ncbi:baseplate wedge initiator [Bacteriophage sp.]|nr:baseplate wedge initiator [Bacteriophage sp.]
MAAAEQKKSYQVVKQFKGINTKANRTAIDESEFSWLENAMPIGYANLKVIPAPTNTGITFSHNVTYFFSGNIGLVDYLFAFEDDGSCEYVRLDTNTKGTLAPAGTFNSAEGNNINVTQWKNQYLLILDSTKGYFTWDGTNLVFIGSVGSIGIVSGGSGYTSAPAVVISAPNQTGGVQAQAVATITANAVSSITLTEAGSGYTSPPTISFSGGGGSGANAVASITTFATGTVTVNVTNGGTGYTNAANTVVTISGGGGANAAGTAILSGGQVTRVIMTNKGSGYTNASNLTVTISGGGGSNATATGLIYSDTNCGIQSFSGRVWIAQGRNVYYSAAGSVSDFTSVSAGSVTLSDSTLHGNIQQILSANNFLYIFGDDSINVFSDVRVTNTGSTLFTNTNVSASVGTKLAYAIFPYFRSVLFMNNYGVYALVGSTTSKISDPLDGVFPNLDFVTEETTAGQVLLNNILCAAFNVRYTGGQGTSSSTRFMQAIFFEKKWFFTSQGNNIKYITSAPVGGKITLYGTDGTNLFQFYTNANAAISSYVQTALMPMTDPIRTKQALKIGIEATASNAASITMSATVDNENRSSNPYTLSSLISWQNNSLSTIGWANNSGATIGWGTTGYALYKTDAQQYGKYLGITVTSSNPAFIYNGFEFEHELRVRF